MGKASAHIRWVFLFPHETIRAEFCGLLDNITGPKGGLNKGVTEASWLAGCSHQYLINF